MDIFMWEQLPEDSKEAPQGLKPQEEIDRFSVDEHLNEVERATLFLSGGLPVQQRKAIDNLPCLLKARGRAAFEAVQPHLQQALQKLDSEAQVATAEAFEASVRDRLLSASDVADCLLPIVLATIKKDKPEEEMDAWVRALSEMLPLLSRDVMVSQVVPLALSKGEVNAPVQSRVTCTRVLGAVALHMVSA
eukprot:jgi/Chrzof1/11269/Cz05g30020.t1